MKSKTRKIILFSAATIAGLSGIALGCAFFPSSAALALSAFAAFCFGSGGLAIVTSPLPPNHMTMLKARQLEREHGLWFK